MATRDPLAPSVPGTPYDANAAYTASQALIPSPTPFLPGAVPQPNLPFGMVPGDRSGSKAGSLEDQQFTQNYQAWYDSMTPEQQKSFEYMSGERANKNADGSFSYYNVADAGKESGFFGFLDKLAPFLVEAGLAATLGPELLGAFGGGILGSAGTGAVLGAADSALTGQDIGKGALTGFAGGGLGSALGGVGKSISGAVGGGTIGDFLSKISTNAISQATMAGVQGKDVGKALESGALSGFFQTLSKDAIKAIVPDNTPGYLSSAAAGAVGGAITGAVKGQDPLASALGGAASSELGYQLSQLGSSAGLSNFEQKALSMALNAAMAKSPSKPTAPTAAKTVAPAATTTASTPPPAATATPTPVMHTTAPQAPTTNLGSTSSTPSSTINPTLSRALSREDSFGGNK